MAAFADRQATKGITETYEYRVEGLAFHFTVDDGSIQLHQGPAQDPAATLITDEQTWADIASGQITGSSAVTAGSLAITGDPQAAKRLRKLFSRNQVLAQAEKIISQRPSPPMGADCG